ncbi:ATP-binding protein [Salipiger sp. PrR002]|uniref:ATP-binding protein n=1 Tax=Salipiger sp. PrR002 TaxID=2706489 RepID=UPI0013B74AAB|nr:ATP-binding protein [Salipiger sp. PrR002]NDW00251.1 ATP-binding protein [Salipiger sp. PrR002]NDW58610.1 ATP-binding protein [Salipiger sp. PrR004]
MTSLPESTRKLSQSLTLGACAAEVRAALAEVAAMLSAHQVSPEARGAIELVLAEALNNIVEHAYAPATAGDIGLRVSLEGEQALLQVCDRGSAMPGLVLPEGRLKPLGHDRDLPEGGFGWYLIRKLASEVRYRRFGGENVLDIVMPLR